MKDFIPGFLLEKEIILEESVSLCHGIRLTDHQPVILKFLNSEHPKIDDITSLEREFEMIKSLSISGILRVIELIYYEKNPILIFEDFKGQVLKNFLLENKMQLIIYLQAASALAKALDQLHSNQIVHREINPEHILFDLTSNEVKIINFQNASQDNSVALSKSLLPNFLNYISPEQTGRVNSLVDYRSDLYSLGATFYEMLTKRPIFISENPLELIHQHIAKKPIPPCDIDPSIPKAVSDIVMKLLEKVPEERYQTAYGLKNDLEECLKQLNSSGNIANFALRTHDSLGIFQISHRLYGREKDLEKLKDSCKRCSKGPIEWILLAGYAGVGKTSLVQEMQKSTLKKESYFITGKYDQLQMDVPYKGLVIALTELVHQVLAKPDAILTHFKSKISQALYPNGQLLIDLIPDLELLIGKQTAPPLLNPEESQTRLNLLFKNFINLFHSENCPLVIFLDDLQWANFATLKLVETLLIDQSLREVLIIGAYRNNEVDPSHPLSISIEEVKKNNGIVKIIELHPLSLDDVNQMIADTLSCTVNRVSSLGSLVFQKTGGNPFFLIQFLKNLYYDHHLFFDPVHKQWDWNFDLIKKAGVSENVVDLMTKKIMRFPVETRQILAIAAAIGERFDLESLALVANLSLKETFTLLWKVVEEELIQPIGKNYLIIRSQSYQESGLKGIQIPFQFVHDRIQHAAYHVITEEERQKIHYKIGQYYLQTTSIKNLEEKIFEIVVNLNQAGPLLHPLERIKLAELNLQACRRAKISSAYLAAYNFAAAGRKMLDEGSWDSHYDLTYSLYMESAECAYPIKMFDEIDFLSKIILAKAKNKIDKGKLYVLKINFHTNISKTEEALDEGLECMRLFDIHLSKHPSMIQILKEFLIVKFKMRNLIIEELEYLPPMQDPEKLFLMRLFINTCPPAFISNKPLLTVLTLKMMSLTLDYGNSEFAFFVYSSYAGVLEIGFKDYPTAYKFGKLSLALAEKYDISGHKCRANYVMAIIINHWSNGLASSEEYMNRCYTFGLESGELLFSSYITAFRGFLDGAFYYNLDEAQQKQMRYENAIITAKNQQALNSFLMKKQIINSLKNESFDGLSLTDDSFDEEVFVKETYSNREQKAAFQAYAAYKGMILYLFGHYQKALDLYKIAKPSHLAGVTLLTERELNFYQSLTMIALYPRASMFKRWSFLRQIKKNQKNLKWWSVCCPVNNIHRYTLIEGELARILGDEAKAIKCFENAIELAKENKFTVEEALGNLFIAKIYLAKREEKKAKPYLEKSRYSFYRWGSPAKIRQMEQEFSALLEKKIDQKTKAGSQSAEALDIYSIMKSVNVLSGKIHPKHLLKRMMKVVIENAGADRAILLLEQSGKWMIQAESTCDYDKAKVLQALPIEENASCLPVSIINYVIRTKSDLLLDNPINSGLFGRDTYIQNKEPKSILCMPIMHQNRLYGIVYLENSIAANVFNPNRLEILHLLSEQMAASIDNAMGFSNLAAATKALQESNKKLEGYNRNLEGKVKEKMQSFLNDNARDEKVEKIRRMQYLLAVKEKFESPKILKKNMTERVRSPLGIVDNFSSLSLETFKDLVKCSKDDHLERERLIEQLRNNLNKIQQYGRNAKDVIKASLIELETNSPEQIVSTDLNVILNKCLSKICQNAFFSDISNMKVETHFDPLVSPIQTMPNRFENAWMNIFENVCVDLQEKQIRKKEGFLPTIIVSTKQLEDAVEILIQDNAAKKTKEDFSKDPNLETFLEVILKEYGGDVKVDSKEDESTQVSIRLPKVKK